MDILVCPFCGNPPQSSVDDDDTTWMYCQDCNIKFPAWHWQTRIPDNNLRADLAQCQRERDALAEVKDAAQIIFNVSSTAFGRAGRSGQVKCPHGYIPSYPTHAWWCDKCFERLQAALTMLDIRE